MKNHMLLVLKVFLCFIVSVSACESSKNQGNETDGDLVDTDNDQELPDDDYPPPPITDGDMKHTDGDRDEDTIEAADGDFAEVDRIEDDQVGEIDWDVTDRDLGDPEPEGPAPQISDFYVIENPNNALSFNVEWSTDILSLTLLSVECGEDYSQTFSDSVFRMNHEVFVMGLFDGAHCEFKALSIGEAGSRASQTQEIDVGPLPDFLPFFSVAAPLKERIQPGWTLFNLSNTYDNQPLLAAMVDDVGRLRWYYRVPTSNAGSDNLVESTPEGVWISGTAGIYPRFINWEGEVLWMHSIPMHHELRPWGEGKILYLNKEKNCSGEAWEGHESIYSPAMILYDLDENKPLWSWVLCHHYTPPEIYFGWAHANAIYPFPGENAVLFSARNLHMLFKVDLDTEEIIWKMGEGGDFTIAADDVYLYQHAPEIQDNGNILLFDNGLDGRREYSRVLELQYTFTNEEKETRVVWSYTPEPVIFSKIWGDADRLDNGNVLTCFGQRSKTESSRLIEVTSDLPAKVVWDLSIDLKWGVYRAERISKPMQGYVKVRVDLTDGDQE